MLTKKSRNSVVTRAGTVINVQNVFVLLLFLYHSDIPVRQDKWFKFASNYTKWCLYDNTCHYNISYLLHIYLQGHFLSHIACKQKCTLNRSKHWLWTLTYIVISPTYTCIDIIIAIKTSNLANLSVLCHLAVMYEVQF